MYNPTAYDKTTDTVLICLKNPGFIFPIFYFLVKIIHSKYLKNALFSTFRKTSEHSSVLSIVA